MKPFYERNDYLLNHKINVFYENIVSMTDKEFETWVSDMRKVVMEAWNTHNCPPRTGKNEQDIINEFNKLTGYPVSTFEFVDELTGNKDVIINKSRLGAEVDQWFPNMYKTRINYSENDIGYSIYDLFANDKYLPKMIKGARRHIRRDSLYTFACSAIKNDTKYAIVSVSTGNEWLNAYFNNPSIFKDHDFILDQHDDEDGLNTGYYQIEQSKILSLTKDDFLNWKPKLSYRHYSTFDSENLSDDKIFRIRVYEKGHKVFPKCFPSFRIGYIQPAVNFPPLTARYLYEKYTESFMYQDRIVIYDPSSGWGGRILGAMSVSDSRNILYVGTDPNVDNFDNSLVGGSKYSSIADFYNTRTYRGNSFFSKTHEYEIFSSGSEVIHKDKKFKKYKGKVDLVFTSPPYFNREAYSDDSNQSYKKFSNYDSWVKGFLRPTLETCVEYLKNNRYLLWNIADIQVSGEYLPLEKDSRDILESLGMKYIETLKMAMEGMPGQNRLDENGKPKCKNFCKVNGNYLKYEPVFVYYKP
jgi:hypothetical protein